LRFDLGPELDRNACLNGKPKAVADEEAHSRGEEGVRRKRRQSSVKKAEKGAAKSRPRQSRQGAEGRPQTLRQTAREIESGGKAGPAQGGRQEGCRQKAPAKKAVGRK
jgi:hypothetical protein